MTTRPDPEDLTARARIRDAAMQHFGEHGFERATIRGIAETAGVSSGLIRHHFGSKQALREACDDYLAMSLRRLNDQVRESFREDMSLRKLNMNHLAAARVSMGPYQRYLARALAEGWAAPLFDQMVEMTEQWFELADKQRPDPPSAARKTRAAVFTAMALAVPILHQHVSRAIGVDLFTPEGDEVLARALLDLYSHPLMSLEDAALAQASLDRIKDSATQDQADRGAELRQLEEQHDD